MMTAATDLTGRVFGHLRVLKRGRSYPSGKARWMVRCRCGAQTLVAAESLLKGRTISCGCQMIRVKHGHASARGYSPTYHTWRGMWGRCTNPQVNGYARYGGRGVTVCSRWREFENFLADMGERPPGKTLDRRDNALGYEPGNCRWATPSEQQANRRLTAP